ncbi:MAG TPA: hypothetical protein VEY10_07435 [Flavisolibacter sp.]|jgi:hypothetical protein|nr:hypothetical protein [Flavisolibacter sp.]
MNRIFYSTSNVILFRLSDNAEHYRGVKGSYRVKYQTIRSRSYATLLEAFLFYITVEEEAELWNISDENTLIEKKVQLYLN